MKGFYKCFGLLLVLFIMVGLSLNVSSGVSALRHEITNIPLYSDIHSSPTYSFVSIRNEPFYFTWVDDYSQFSHYKKFTYFAVDYNDGQCVYGGHYYEIPNSSNIFYSFPSYYNVPYNSPNPSYFSCSQPTAWGTPYGEFTSHPQFSVGSIGETSGVPLIEVYFLRSIASAGYYYEYNSIPLHHTSIDSGSGIHYSWAYKMSDLFNDDVIPNKFGMLRIPLGFANASDIGPLTSGRHFDIDGTFTFPISSSSDLTFSSAFETYGNINLMYSYINSSGNQYFSDSFACQRTLTYAEFDGAGQYSWSYSCPFDLPTDMMYLTFTLDVSINTPYGVNIPDSDRYIFDTTSDWFWSGGFVTTDYDSTPGNSWSGDYNGGNLDATPGSNDPTNNSEDWFASLTNLFNFSFFNPFAPLFQLFTDNSQCANIPTIAGMLGSDDTTYCPWFPASVRNILTPVLSISSLMLVFGFLIRWLGSSSGNMFEDQTSHKWNNTQFKQGGSK